MLAGWVSVLKANLAALVSFNLPLQNAYNLKGKYLSGVIVSEGPTHGFFAPCAQAGLHGSGECGRNGSRGHRQEGTRDNLSPRTHSPSVTYLFHLGPTS